MAVQVEFVTLGDASKILDVPAPTLRLWTDELEKHEVHYVSRNHRDERIYYESDLEIFKYMRDLKKEHGRKTQTKDIALTIFQLSVNEDRFDLRRRVDAPRPEQTSTSTELMSHKDIEKIFESERARQVLDYMIVQATDRIHNQLVEEMRETLKAEIMESKTETQIVLEEIEERRKKREEERDRLAEQRAKEREERQDKKWAEFMELQKQKMEEASKPKSFWDRLTGK